MKMVVCTLLVTMSLVVLLSLYGFRALWRYYEVVDQIPVGQLAR
jgi:hypothetical protein